jgi:type I restriction enzyme S subunit
MVKAGYKQTEVGVIPEDWEIYTLGQCSSKITDGTHDTPKPVVDGIPFLTALHIKSNTIDFELAYFLPKKTHDLIYSRCNPEKNDVLMVNIGAGVGTTALVNVDYEFSLKNVALIKPNKSKALGSFLNQHLIHYRDKNNFSLLAGGAQPFFSLSMINKIKIATPSLKEQTAIATALSDVDALITSLTDLIDKKRQIKTATMQQLLTGKQRLAGFGEGKGMKPTELGEIPEDWEVFPLKKLVKSLDAGVSVNSVETFLFDEGLLYILKTSCINNGNFYPNEIKEILKAEIKRAKTPLEKNTIVISRMNTPDLVGEIGYIPKDYCNLFLPDRLWLARFNTNKVDAKWLSTLLCYKPIREKIKEMATGTSNSMKNISKSDLLALLTPYTTFPEQQAIAQVLSDMDDDLHGLETRLAKTKAIKQGMMQELLTGRTRLV